MTQVTVEANNVRQMLDALIAKYPALAPTIEKGVAISVNGQIHRDEMFLPLDKDSEIYLFPKMAGG